MIMDYVFTRSKRNTNSNKVSVGKLVAKFKDEFKAEAKTKRRKKEIRCKKKKACSNKTFHWTCFKSDTFNLI